MNTARTFPTIAKLAHRRYRATVAAKSVTGFGDPNLKLAHMRPKTIAGAFFVSAMPLYGGRAWETERSAGCQLARFANLQAFKQSSTLGGGGGVLQSVFHAASLPICLPSSPRT